jgi:hypothetical protein
MMTKTLRLLSLAAALALSGTGHAQDAPVPRCASSGIALQLLGSGGPISDDARASSGAIVWINGHARILIDAAAAPICATVSPGRGSKTSISSAFRIFTPIIARICLPS